jgi:RNA polymerase sigma factor (sigma-70 family)
MGNYPPCSRQAGQLSKAENRGASLVLRYYGISHLRGTECRLLASKCSTGYPMPSKRETTRPAFLLNSVDRLGRSIDPGVLSVAQEISQQALAYAEKILGDPAVVQNLFEEAAAAVSEAVETKKESGKPPVRDLRAYLFRAFVRRISQERRKQVASKARSELFDERQGTTRSITSLEMSLLLDEALAACDKVTQEIAIRRLEGFSWEEIGTRYGISAHAARIRFSKALQRIRKALKARGIGG